MFAAIEIKLLILVAFAILSAVSSWMKKRQGGGQDGEKPGPASRPRAPGAPAPPPIQPPPKPVSWEEELRRLLQGETAEPEPAPPPPPPVVFQTRHPAPPPLSERRPRPVFEGSEEPSPVQVEVPPRFHPMPTRMEAVQTREQASQLDRQVEPHLREVTRRPAGSTSAHRLGTTPEASAALALVRNPKSVRAALLASIILGPPRALAD